MSKFSQIIEDDWTGKVEYFKSMGARFTKDCRRDVQIPRRAAVAEPTGPLLRPEPSRRKSPPS